MQPHLQTRCRSQFGRALIRADLELMPDDGHRYELIDGALIVSPSPQLRHQHVVGNLYLLLRAACPEHLKVALPPFDVVLASDTVVIPDLLVATRTRFTNNELPGPPLLAVVVLPPSTRRIDLLLKRDRFQASGVPLYWLVDPVEVAVTVLQLADGVYEQVAHVVGSESFDVSLPYPMAVVPARLLA